MSLPLENKKQPYAIFYEFLSFFFFQGTFYALHLQITSIECEFFFSFLISSICKRFTYISFFPPFSASQKKTKKGRKNGTILLLLNCVTFSASSSLFITICLNQFVCLFQLLHSKTFLHKKIVNLTVLQSCVVLVSLNGCQYLGSVADYEN